MSSTLDAIAEALGVEAVTAAESRLLLDATRDVAHGSQRRFAPLAAFLVGVAVADSPDRAAAIEQAVSAVRAVLPAPAPPGPEER